MMSSKALRMLRIQLHLHCTTSTPKMQVVVLGRVGGGAVSKNAQLQRDCLLLDLQPSSCLQKT